MVGRRSFFLRGPCLFSGAWQAVSFGEGVFFKAQASPKTTNIQHHKSYFPSSNHLSREVTGAPAPPVGGCGCGGSDGTYRPPPVGSGGFGSSGSGFGSSGHLEKIC